MTRRIYTPNAATVRAEMTLVESRIYASRVIELWRDDLDCNSVEWRRHYVIRDGGTPVGYRGEDAAVASINGIIESIDEELELADIEAAAPTGATYEVREQSSVAPEVSRLLRVAATFAEAMNISADYNARGVNASVHTVSANDRQ